MHLARTGAFLRAVRNARLAGPRPQRVQAQPCERWSSQSSQVSAPSAEAPSTPSERQVSAEINSFRKTLQSSPQNKIVSDGKQSGSNILGQPYVFDSTTNVTNSILSLVGRNLYELKHHPIGITRRLIEEVFHSGKYLNTTASNPVVTTAQNFDVLGFPGDHPGRSRTDTYYIDSKTVLRTHTSAHQHAAFEALQHSKERGYTICADVYRRDSIDRSHFPVFHQMEGARVWDLYPPGLGKHTRLQMQQQRAQRIRDAINLIPKHDLEIIDEAGPYNDATNPVQIQHDIDDSQLVVEHLKRSLEQLVQKVFVAAQAANPSASKEPLKVRWIEAYFPFTSPSFELEVWYNGEWLELLGCGVVKQSILDNAGLPTRIGWAWGLGIERLAMILFNIPDIRLFWSQDERFLKQFSKGKITRFEPFSKYPPCYKDISFWVLSSPPSSVASPVAADPAHGSPSSSIGIAAAAGGDATKARPNETQPHAFHENDIMEIVRNVAGTLVEDVKLVDEFVNPKNGKKSLCYRINYRSNERTLTNEEVNELHAKVLKMMEELPIQIR